MLCENDMIQHENKRYQIQCKIGSESSFGAVFKALDDEARPVVVKQLLGREAIARDAGMDYDYARHTFEREARILLSHNHPHIVKAYDFFEYEDSLLVVMEYINGEDLDQVLIKKLEREGLAFSEAQAAPIGVALCEVIHAIHQLPGQVLYRDLKPRNVMWDAKNRYLKLIDFGTARFMEEDQNPTQALGTPGYAPPEFYTTSQPLTFAADVYTIGATLYELVSGDVPEPLLTPSHFHSSELSPEFCQIIIRAMDQDPRRRYQTAGEMGHALAEIQPEPTTVNLPGSAQNPYPYLSCLCTGCGTQPADSSSVFCGHCGSKIHVMLLRIQPDRKDVEGIDLFLDKAENLIGRIDMDEHIFPDIDLARYDPDCFVSRQHCKLTRKGNQFFLEALRTTNHTAINGNPLKPGRAVVILPSTQIQLANLKVEFICKPCLEA